MLNLLVPPILDRGEQLIQVVEEHRARWFGWQFRPPLTHAVVSTDPPVHRTVTVVIVVVDEIK